VPHRTQIDPRGGVAVQPRQVISDEHASRVLNISVVEHRSERRLILEGELLAPWVTELRTPCEKARSNLQNRELVIDLKNLTAISQESKDVLLELINERGKFRCGVFTKHVLRQLACRTQETVRGRNRTGEIQLESKHFQ
jgi:hypothetical protein